MLQKVFHIVNNVMGLLPQMIGYKHDLSTINTTSLKSKTREDDRWIVNIIKEIVNTNQIVLKFAIEEDESFLSHEQLHNIL